MAAAPGVGGFGPQSRAARRHAHLWSLPDGTGLHAPPGRLLAEAGTGRLCCHLCGEWFASLGIHVRVHGHTAGSYRAAMGLPRTAVLAASRPARRGGGAGPPAGDDATGEPSRLPVGREMAFLPGRVDAAAPGGIRDPDGLQEERATGWTIIVQASAEPQNSAWARVLLYRASSQ